MSSIKEIDKIIYISPRDMRKNRADAVHIMYSCAAFVNNRIEVELITPKVIRQNYSVKKSDIFSLYNIKENFKIVELNTKIKENKKNQSSMVLVLLNKFIFHFLYIFNNVATFRNSGTIVYSKCYVSVLPYIFLKKTGLLKSKIIFETPFLKDNNYHKFIMINVDAIVVMTSFVKDFIVSKFKINKAKVIKSPIRFQSDYESDYVLNKLESRSKIGWVEKCKYVVYAGKAGTNLNRIKDFVKAAKQLPLLKFIIVGATEDLILEYSENKPKNVLIYPFQSYPDYLNFVNAADVLVATYEDNLYNRYTLSPGKGGAYLQSGNPVIFTDLPCLRERFSNDLVSFVNPDDSIHLVEKIQEIVDNISTFKSKAEKAKKFVEERTFTDAAKFILMELNNKFFVEQK